MQQYLFAKNIVEAYLCLATLGARLNIGVFLIHRLVQQNGEENTMSTSY